MRTNLTHRPSLVFLAGAALATAAVSSAPTATATGTAEEAGPAARLFRLPDALAEDVAGAVFTMTNSADPVRGNEVVAFNRLDDGSLVVAGYFPTGGLGAGPAPTSTVLGAPVPIPLDPLGSQDSLILTEGRGDEADDQNEPAAVPAHKRGDNPRRLFAVNAGSNSITCFRVETDESGTTLSAPNTVDSGGLFPVSLTFRRTGGGSGVLYVLNAGGGGNVTGFRVSSDCGLDPLPGGQRSLEGLIDDPPFPEPAPNEVLTTADQVAFTPSGSQLVVAIKGGPEPDGEGGFEGGVVVFQTSPSSGLLRDRPPTVTEFSMETATAGPFGFTFDENGNLVLNHVGSLTVATYRIEDSGALTQLGGPIQISGLDDDSVLNFGALNCWIVRRGDIVYVMSSGDIPATSGGLPDGPGVISALRVADDGSLSLLPVGVDEFGAEGVVAVLPQDDRDAFDPDNPELSQVFGNHGIDLTIVENGDRAFLYAIEPRLGQIGAWEIEADGTLTPVGNFNGGLTPGVDPFAGTNPGINDFLERCFLQDEPRSPECAQGSAQGIVGF